MRKQIINSKSENDAFFVFCNSLETITEYHTQSQDTSISRYLLVANKNGEIIKTQVVFLLKNQFPFSITT